MLISEAKLYGVFNFTLDYHTVLISHHVNMYTLRMVLPVPCMCVRVFVRWGGGGGGKEESSHVNIPGMLVVSFRGEN